MKTETSTNVTTREVELFKQASKAAEDIYAPMGFFSPALGYLHHIDLPIELLPFWERGAEDPLHYALRSAFEAGCAKGFENSQQKTI